jgi:hypothetical protein
MVVESRSQVKTDTESGEALGNTSGKTFTISGSTFLSLQR